MNSEDSSETAINIRKASGVICGPAPWVRAPIRLFNCRCMFERSPKSLEEAARHVRIDAQVLGERALANLELQEGAERQRQLVARSLDLEYGRAEGGVVGR